MELFGAIDQNAPTYCVLAHNVNKPLDCLSLNIFVMYQLKVFQAWPLCVYFSQRSQCCLLVTRRQMI